MSNFKHIDDQMLAAFVDGDLDDSRMEIVLAAMEAEPEIRERVYQLRCAKDFMRLGFSNATPPSRRAAYSDVNLTRKQNRVVPFARVASVLLLVTATVTAYVGYYSGRWLSDKRAQHTAVQQQSQATRVVLHISRSDPDQFAAVFDYIEDFLRQHDKNGNQIEVVANAAGLDLIRAGVSPYEERLNAVIGKHQNVHFIACANSIRSLRKKGVEPRFHEKVRTAKPAFDHIIDRVQDGWTYLKVDSLTET